jgi:transcriptional regulator with GAF, ATPase, and Fis domain
MLKARSFPGNVRELRNFIERSVSLGFITPSKEPASRAPQVAAIEKADAASRVESLVPLHLPLKDARQAWIESFEEIYLRSMLKKTGGNVTKAAELAGVSRRFLQRLAARLGIRAPSAGAGAPDLDREDE